MLTTLNSSEALDPVDRDHAFLAVSRATSDYDEASTTAVFATADGGRTWTESAVFKTSAPVARLSFADDSHGWLLVSPAFETPGQPVTWLYRTSDGGLRWSPAWNSGGDTAGALPPPLYATANSGRTWRLVIPHLVTG
jgi:photosystem II stability/assembly factor-like uncharacterized protein